jgi:hypothetical protein
MKINDETLPIINKTKHPKKKKKEYMEQNERTHMSKKTKEPPKRANHKGNIKFSNPFLSKEAYQIRKEKDLLKGCLT